MIRHIEMNTELIYILIFLSEHVLPSQFDKSCRIVRLVFSLNVLSTGRHGGAVVLF